MYTCILCVQQSYFYRHTHPWKVFCCCWLNGKRPKSKGRMTEKCLLKGGVTAGSLGFSAAFFYLRGQGWQPASGHCQLGLMMGPCLVNTVIWCEISFARIMSSEMCWGGPI